MKPNWPLVVPGASPKVQQALAQIHAILTGGGTIADNQFAALLELPFTHGEQILRSSPLRGGSLPKGFDVIAAWDSNNQAMPDPICEFDENVDGSGEFGLTFYAPHPFGSASVYRNAAYSTANATNDPLPVDTAAFSQGSLSLDTTNKGIACAEAGLVMASYAFEWSAAGVGTYRRAFLWLNQSTATEIWGRQYHSQNSFALSGSGLIQVAKGDVIGVAVNQDSGGTLALTTGIRRCKVDAHYVDRVPRYSGTVLGILWGG